MTRLDRLVIIAVVLAVIGSFFVQLHYDPLAGRRPVPETTPPVAAETAPATATLTPLIPATRVRRPLPSATSFDPLVTAEVEDLPPGMVEFGTSFPIGNHIWLTARHVANGGCQTVFLILDGSLHRAQIRYLHPEADLAMLETDWAPTFYLPVSTADVVEDETGYSFGYPGGNLGGTENALMGRSRLRLEGHLSGVAAVLTWAEVRRFPDSLDSLGGISGGPMLDEDGNVVGIAVASSVRRGRNHSVAPELLREAEGTTALLLTPLLQRAVSEVEGGNVALDEVAAAMAGDARIAKTYCVPPKN